MKLLLKKMVFFAIVIVFTAGALEAWLFIRMKERRAHVLEDWPDLMALESDFVFLGNSRTAGHVIPKRIEQQGLRGYNIAYDGFTSHMGASRLDFLLTHSNPPKYVFVQCDLSFISGNGRLKNFPMKDGMLRFFFLDQLGINQYFREYENWREADTYVPLLRYKGYPLMFVKHVLGWDRWNRKENLGFWHTDKEVGFELKDPIDAVQDKLHLCGIDSICREHDIELIGLIPPSPQSIYRPKTSALQKLNSDFEIWDFSKLFATSEKEYFYDKAHFSFRGAQIYSDSISARFEKKLSKQSSF